MQTLSKEELMMINGGSIISKIYSFLYGKYQIIKIKWLMKKVFID